MTVLSNIYHKMVWTYHKIIEKIYWKFGYVYIPEGDIFKNGVGEKLTEEQKEYFLRLCDRYMELYSNIGWDGLPFSMFRREDKVKILAIFAFTIIFAVLYVYLVISYGNTGTIITDNGRINIHLK